MNDSSQKYYRNASGQLTFGADFPSEKYKNLCQLIVAQFGLNGKDEPFVDSLGDIAFQHFQSEGKIIELAWDIWMGFTVTAETPDAEYLVQRIGSFIVQHYKLE